MVKILEGQRQSQKTRMLKHYEMLELWEFERGTDEAFALRSVLGEPVEEIQPAHLAQLPLVIVGYDQVKITQHLSDQRADPRTRLRPIAVVGLRSEALDPTIACLADIVLPPHPSRGELQDTALSLDTLATHLKRLTLAPQDPAMAMLQFLYSRHRELEPMVDAHSALAYRFPLAESLLDLNTREAREILVELAERGLLDSQHVDRMFTCPDCESYRVVVKELCPECHSTNIGMEESIHHFRCGHVAPESEFSLHGYHQCPKCDAAIRHIGVEYNRPGRFAVCRSCRFWATEPELAAWCADCDQYHSPAQLHSASISVYTLSAMGADVAVRGSWNPSAALANSDDTPGLSDRYAEELAKRVVEVAHHSGRAMTVYRAVLLDAGGDNISPEAVITEVRNVLRDVLREQDVIVNTGGSEFLILLPEEGPNAPPVSAELEEHVMATLGVALMITGMDGQLPYSAAASR